MENIPYLKALYIIARRHTLRYLWLFFPILFIGFVFLSLKTLTTEIPAEAATLKRIPTETISTKYKLERSDQTTTTTTTTTTVPPVERRIHQAKPQAVPSTIPAPKGDWIPQWPGVDIWAKLRNCESGGNYSTNTGNGYYGAYQFSAATWNSMGTGYAFAHLAPPEIQDDAAKRLQIRSGWGQWPACTKMLGLR